MPWRPSSAASVSPTGPPPAMSTGTVEASCSKSATRSPIGCGRNYNRRWLRAQPSGDEQPGTSVAPLPQLAADLAARMHRRMQVHVPLAGHQLRELFLRDARFARDRRGIEVAGEGDDDAGVLARGRGAVDVRSGDG